MTATTSLGVVWLILLIVARVDHAVTGRETFIGASLLAATIALVTVLALDALHAGGVL